jgi:hypothetical protein
MKHSWFFQNVKKLVDTLVCYVFQTYFRILKESSYSLNCIASQSLLVFFSFSWSIFLSLTSLISFNTFFRKKFIENFLSKDLNFFLKTRKRNLIIFIHFFNFNFWFDFCKLWFWQNPQALLIFFHFFRRFFCAFWVTSSLTKFIRMSL